MSNIVYAWKPGARISVDPQVAGRYINGLCKKYGKEISAEILLEEDTKNKKSPFSSYYTWDEHKAAHECRLSQARDILRSLRFEVDREGDVTLSVRAFPMVADSTGQSMYRPIEVVMADPQLRASHIESAYREYVSFRNRWQHLKELVELFTAADKVMDSALNRNVRASARSGMAMKG